MTGLLRVSIVAGNRRTDLALPGAVAVAELVPELARSLGVLDAQTVHGGYHLVTADGRRLSPSAGLGLQHVHDGDVLTLAQGIDAPVDRVYDDVVEAMADAVESTTTPWSQAAARLTTLVAAAGLLGLGAAAIALQRPDVLAGALAGVVAVLLLVAAGVVARVRAEHEVAVLLAWGAVVFAGVAGFTMTSGAEVGGLPLDAAGAGAALVGIAAFSILPERRTLLIPAIVVAAIVAAAAGVVAATDLSASAVYTVALTAVVVLSGLIPVVALTASGSSAPQPEDPTSLPDEPTAVDLAAVRRGAQFSHDIMLAILVGVGLVATALAPLAVSRGLAGTLLAAAAGFVLLTRTRQHRAGAEVFAGLAAGLAVVVSTAVSVIVLHPDWRSVLAVVLAVIGAATMLTSVVPQPETVRRGRLLEIVEMIALLAMLPLTVFAIGLLGAVRG